MQGTVVLLAMLVAVAVLVLGIIGLVRSSWWVNRSLYGIALLTGFAMIAAIIIGMAGSRIVLEWIGFTLLSGVALAVLLFWAAMLADCALNETEDGERLVWVLIIIFAQIIGALIYYFGRRPRRLAAKT